MNFKLYNKIINVDYIISILLIILLTFMINLPTVHKDIKLVILILLVSIIVLKLFIRKRIYIDKDILIFFLITIFFSFIFMLNGLINNTPGATKVVTVMTLWPILWMLIISSIQNKDILNKINKVFIYSTYFIISYTIYFVLVQFAIVPNELFINIYPVNKSGMGYYDGVIETSLLVFASLLFLIPYLIASIHLDVKLNKTKLFMLILGIFVLIMSGRRALVVVSLFSIFLIFLIKLNFKNYKIKYIFKKNKKIYGYVILVMFSMLIILINTNFISIDAMIERFSSGFDFANAQSDGAYARYLQFYSLLDGWSKAPIFGNGLGAVADVLRSDETPWAYELSYNALLFHTGIVGILVYGLATLWIMWQLLLIIKSNDIYFIKIAFPTLIGMISFLIGNATNPYLGKFDFMWVIFIPVMIINIYKINKRKNRIEQNI